MNLTTTGSAWQRVSRRHPCPVCGRPDWCMVAGPADYPDAAICARVESDKRAGSKGAGWLHRLRDDHGWQPRRRTVRVPITEPAVRPCDLSDFAARCEMAASVASAERLAADLGLSLSSLLAMGVGWSAEHGAWTFPMQDADGYIQGIRLRLPSGRKLSVRGGREGLFIPMRSPGSLLVVCEGPTDTAALVDLGFTAVGRPSCNGGVGLLVDLVCNWHPKQVVVMADADAPGQRGARYLASRLVGYVAEGVKIVTPPAKDAREWVRRGATRAEALAAIGAAPTMTLRYGGVS